MARRNRTQKVRKNRKVMKGGVEEQMGATNENPIYSSPDENTVDPTVYSEPDNSLPGSQFKLGRLPDEPPPGGSARTDRFITPYFNKITGLKDLSDEDQHKVDARKHVGRYWHRLPQGTSFEEAVDQHEKNHNWDPATKSFVEKEKEKSWFDWVLGGAPAKKKKPRKGKGKKRKPSKSKGKKKKPSKGKSKGRGKGTPKAKAPKRKPTNGSRKKATHRAKQVLHTLQRKRRGKKSKRGPPKRRAGARVQANPYSEQFEFQI